MKISDSEIIKNGEQELIDAITADLDWGAIEDIFLKEHNLGIEEDIEYKNGDIIAVDNQIAYKLEFEVKVNLSVLLDRNGEYLSVTISNRKENPEEDGGMDIHSESPEPETTDTHSEESAPEKETELSKFDNVSLYPLDVTNENSVNVAVEQIINDFGKVDVIVNNAGKGLFGIFEASSSEQIRDQYETNLFGTMDVIKTFNITVNIKT